MHLVGTGDPGLLIRPTHRAVAGLPALDADRLLGKLSPTFELAERFDNADACWEYLQLAGTQETLGFVTPYGPAIAVELADIDAPARAAPDQSPEWRSLAVSLLHTVALPLLAPESELGFRYHHEVAPVLADLRAGRARLGALVPAATLAHLEVVAGGRETMPPKSTYFYPKVPTGLVFNSLKKD